VRRAALIATAALLGCRSDEEGPPIPVAPGYEAARGFRDCAPWDGPAITIYLAETPATSDDVPFPHVRLSLYGADGTLSGATLSWRDDEPNRGSAAHCTGPGACRTPSEARVRLGALGNGVVPGDVVLRFVDGSEFRTRFLAELDTTPTFCG